MNRIKTICWQLQFLGVVLFFYGALIAPQVQAASGVDSSLKPESAQEISNVFRDMGVVQNKAMNKSGRFLLSTYGGFDFSDGPYTNYSVNVNPGYAVSDFLEIYFSYVPRFLASPRSIVEKVGQLQLIDGRWAAITASSPKSQYGLEILWAPLYGKDSLGMRHVVRSDTFLKFAVSQLQFEGDTGMRYVLGVGKTFFMSSWLGFRFCIDYTMLDTIVGDGQTMTKSLSSMMFIEGGLVVYL